MPGKEKPRDGRGRGGQPSREVTVSKAISWLLRHGAEKEGLKLDAHGYLNVADLLAWRKLKSLGVTLDELKHIVADNDKQRFSMISVPTAPVRDTQGVETHNSAGENPALTGDPNFPSSFMIRANQGHSIRVDSSKLLAPITEEDIPPVAVHGTTHAAWPVILSSGGLQRMNRTHIHFARGLPGGSDRVISGMRRDSQVLIYVNVKAALQSGIKWWQSENEVILTEGDEKGCLPLKFFEKVEERQKGLGILWERGNEVQSLPTSLISAGAKEKKKNKGKIQSSTKDQSAKDARDDTQITDVRDV
ncbi:hypothetical protein L228DRAFT_148639 [Xylona heveae TC161]|uniref:2'-phosphotransferase n=1 Tax=Xylona heveae (strain CBS 132557 / TC161) TaxID=1328760 RepID=A0A165GI95_XYLHT|nr:hypothetical protein L228DRAFT_148639 [Xylona heveae TC161]KZF22215.1 hypothetical protein L228DRAFT_148639 [Xylona heveae TC161]